MKRYVIAGLIALLAVLVIANQACSDTNRGRIGNRVFEWSTTGAAGSVGSAGGSMAGSTGTGGTGTGGTGTGGAAGSAGSTGTGGTGTGGTGTGGTGTGGIGTGGIGTGGTGTGGSIGGACGNGTIDPGESCDGSALDNATCTLLGYSGGSLACSSSCQFDVSSCTGAAVTLTVTASRTSCKAPCGVFFDATSTTGLSGSNYWRANWAWDFNDPTSSHLGTIGFNVSHVFDNPGTYNVVTRVHDLAGNAGSATTTITVTAMSGTTYYVASSGSDANNGTSMSTPFLTVPHAVGVGYNTNNSILFRRGDTFSMTGFDGGGVYFDAHNGPFLFGAYTDPGSPSSQDPIFTLSADLSTLFGPVANDIRIQHIKLVGPNTSMSLSTGVAQWFDIQGNNALIEYVEMTGSGSLSNNGSISIHIDGSGVTAPFIFDCNFHDFVGYGIFGGNEQVSIVGNSITNFTGTTASPLHGVRLASCSNGLGTCAVGLYLAENTITVGPTGQIFTAFTIHGDTKNSVVVGNKVDHPCGIGPTNTSVVENPNTGLFEGNVMDWPASGVGYTNVDIDAPKMEVRNNLFVNGDIGVRINGNYPLLAANFVDQVFVENNTDYQNPPSGAVLTYAVFFGNHTNTTGAATFLNNIFVEGMTATSSSFINVDGAGTETVDFNGIFGVRSTPVTPGVGTHGITTDPKFASPPADSTQAVTPSMFFLQSSSPAKDTGTNTRAYEDFYRVVRPQNGSWDMGAFERKNP